MDTCHYKLVQIHKVYNTKNESSGKLWTLGNYDVECRFINLVGNLSVGE